ncbi:hypothetical protein M422DRAFT_58598 [Sphaerobolus stellatus SS14]|nr:hypothetical protein M422DRAFT_58598 [Sphaerobolus stellatus SS14]
MIQEQFSPQAPVRLDAAAVPNPFKVDGGSNGEVCPLQPLLVRPRNVDVIFAVDASADREDNFTNGTDLITAAQRAARFGNQYPFPKVPSSPNTFVNQGLTSRPTFFGCDEPDVPLVVYLANGAPSAKRRALGLPGITNTSTGQTSYTPEQAQTFMNEAFAIATQGLGGNSTSPGAQFSTCLACALVDRVRDRQRIPRQGLCSTCMENYCWDGKE